MSFDDEKLLYKLIIDYYEDENPAEKERLLKFLRRHGFVVQRIGNGHGDYQT